MDFADPERIGTGWSYRGFMAVNALLTRRTFSMPHSAARRSRSGCTTILFTPNATGAAEGQPYRYRDAALTLEAKNLKGKLMLADNFEDDNVLFQNMLQLTDALQLAGKQFEYMLYLQKPYRVTGPAAQQMNQ